MTRLMSFIKRWKKRYPRKILNTRGRYTCLAHWIVRGPNKDDITYYMENWKKETEPSIYTEKELDNLLEIKEVKEVPIND